MRSPLSPPLLRPVLARTWRAGGRLLVVLLLAVGLSSITTGLVSAAPPKGCSCRVSGGVGTRAEGVSTVFTAQVTSQQLGAVGTGKLARQVRRYTATVERVYQGTVSQRQVVVVSPASAKDCGLGKIPADKTWLFFVNGTKAKFYGNACQGSERATSALLRRVERVLGSGQVVVEPEPARPPLAWTDVDTGAPPPLGRLVAPGAAAGLIGLLGLAAVGLARRRTPATESP